jgi:hypothetical protein
LKRSMSLTCIMATLALAGCNSSTGSRKDRNVSDAAPVEDARDRGIAPEAAEAPERAQADEALLVLDEALMKEWGKGEAYRGRVELPGYLRFSWLTLWEDVDVYEKELVMRFFVDDAGRGPLPEVAAGDHQEHPPVISLYKGRDRQRLVHFDAAAMQQLIDQDFEYVPQNFQSFEEGHAQQAGTLVMDGLLVETVADRPYFFGRFVSFEPESSEERSEELGTRLDAQANAAGPQHGPAYEESFYLTEPGVLYTEPAEASDRVAELAAQEFLLKIRTIDATWYEASLKRDEETTGFIRRDILAPVN